MRISLDRTRVVLATTAALAVIAAIGVLAATASPRSRQSLLRALERPASPVTTSVAAGRMSASVQGRPYRAGLRLTPNRASARNRLSLLLSSNGRAVRGASVTVSFSMPAMNMWQAFTVRLKPSHTGTYTASVPVVGMAGLWQLRVDVGVPHTARATLIVDDRMRS
jgi:hypothetical protein